MYETFGPHVTLDLRKCNKSRLSNFDFIFDILNNLPDMIGMTKLTQPYVFKYEGKVPEDKGITGFVVIAESHISIHTFENKDYVFVDIFSSRLFNYDKAVDFFVKAFESKDYDLNVVKRGKGFRLSEVAC